MSLFPFLAVLVCTMGAMVVLLVIVVQQARVQAGTIADDQRSAATENEPLLREIEAERRRVETLRDAHAQATADLEHRTLELSHLEDHTRRLRDQLQRLQRDAQALSHAGEESLLDEQFIEEEIRRTEEKLAEARRQLEHAAREAEKQRRSFAIIPYEGAHGTRRRPIYVECRAGEIILQPEDVRLTDSDFAAPIGPDNPLAAALRAKREFVARYVGVAQQGEPYPLLIVRPDGAHAYVAARQAMKSWDAQFGYELVGADMELAFPPADPALVELLNRTVKEARQRQQQRQALGGGFGYGSGPGVGDGGGFRGGRGGLGRSGGGDDDTFFVPSPDGGFARVDGNGRRVHEDPSLGGNGPLGGSEHSDGSDRPLGGGQRRPAGQGGVTPTSPHPGGQATGPGGANPQTQQPPPGQPGQPGTTAGGTQQDASGQRVSPQPGAAQAGEVVDADLADGAPAGPTQSGGAAMISLARSRGRNWGLPHATQQSTGVTRPVRVICHPDQLIILPQRGSNASPRVVNVEQSTRKAVDPFVSELWKHMEGWGIAGPAMFWKPVLKVEVGPGGQTNFEHLDALLRDSGIVVERAAP